MRISDWSSDVCSSDLIDQSALVVGVGGLIDARVLGAGYSNIQTLVDGSMALRAAVILLAVKAVVWLVALSSGTSGGVLAPLLILGGAAGCIAGLWLPGSTGFWAIIEIGRDHV